MSWLPVWPCSLGLLLVISALMAQASNQTQHRDPRLREQLYDPNAVVSVPVKRGIVTLIQLGEDEAITDVASGLGADCSKPDLSWCIATQIGGRALFIKPKSGANEPNNLAVVSDRRIHSFKLLVLDDKDPKPSVYRLQINAPQSPVKKQDARPPSHGTHTFPKLALPEIPLPVLPEPLDLVSERMKAKPQLRNAQYDLAQGKGSDDIVPTLVFDDGLFTYLRFPGNREVPAVFHVLGDGTESLVNTRMEGEFLVVDRVSRQLVLRAGSAVVGIWNEAFDLDGKPPEAGTTISGVQRTLKPARTYKRSEIDKD